MREIKIRAWDKEEKHFWFFTLQEILERRMSYSGSWDEKVLKGEKTQYTGLKDKNGKEIYEGDIVKSEHCNPEYEQIEFIEGGFCLTNPLIEGYPMDINIFYPSVGCLLEVVGNIYEKPELIRQ